MLIVEVIINGLSIYNIENYNVSINQPLEHLYSIWHPNKTFIRKLGLEQVYIDIAPKNPLKLYETKYLLSRKNNKIQFIHYDFERPKDTKFIKYNDYDFFNLVNLRNYSKMIESYTLYDQKLISISDYKISYQGVKREQS